MSSENKIKINNEELCFSGNIDCTINEENEKKIEVYIHKTYENMQYNYSDFESIIICIWSLDPERIVTLKFDSYFGKDDHEENRGKEWSNLEQPCYINEKGQKRAEPARLHHMRFLYRVMKFRERYQGKGFILHYDNITEVDKFERLYRDALRDGRLCLTEPTKEGGLTGYDKDKGVIKDEEGIKENHLEKWFVLRSLNNNLPKQIVKEFGNNRLYDQLPCSMFIGEKSEATRIFNDGAFDLWGINKKKELCVFELKREGNEELGIISELFFYAMIMKDMKQVAKNQYRESTSTYRGFNKFVENENGDIVNAYFLITKLYSFLEKPKVKNAFIDILNEGNDGIKFDLIEFNQDEDIVKGSKRDFFESIVRDLKNSGLLK